MQKRIQNIKNCKTVKNEFVDRNEEDVSELSNDLREKESFFPKQILSEEMYLSTLSWTFLSSQN